VRSARLEWAVEVMAHWLVQAQTGFSGLDADGIVAILRGEQDHNVPALKPRAVPDE
jgi:hypothetical protein